MNFEATDLMIDPTRPVVALDIPYSMNSNEFYYVSYPHVMKSNAGYYIGTLAVHFAGFSQGLPEPNSRLTDYFREEASAVAHWKEHFAPTLAGKQSIEKYDFSRDYTEFLTDAEREALAADAVQVKAANDAAVARRKAREILKAQAATEVTP